MDHADDRTQGTCSGFWHKVLGLYANRMGNCILRDDTAYGQIFPSGAMNYPGILAGQATLGSQAVGRI